MLLHSQHLPFNQAAKIAEQLARCTMYPAADVQAKHLLSVGDRHRAGMG